MAAAPREAMETDCAPEPPVRPAVPRAAVPPAAADSELETRLLRALHGAESYHWTGIAE